MKIYKLASLIVVIAAVIVLSVALSMKLKAATCAEVCESTYHTCMVNCPNPTCVERCRTGRDACLKRCQ
jgi:hypothetical protein